MKKTYLYQTFRLFRKAIWFFVFISLLSLNYFPTTNFFTGLGEYVLRSSAESQRETPKQTDQKKSVPFSNPTEEKSDSDNRNKDLDETIYSKNRRLVSEKTEPVFKGYYCAVIKKILKDEPIPHYVSNASNTCFASLYRFSIFKNLPPVI